MADSSVSRTSSETACELAEAVHAASVERAESPPHVDLTLQSVPEEGPEDWARLGSEPGSRPLSPALVPMAMTPVLRPDVPGPSSMLPVQAGTPSPPRAPCEGLGPHRMDSTEAGLEGGGIKWADAVELLPDEHAGDELGPPSEHGSDGSGGCPTGNALLTGAAPFYAYLTNQTESACLSHVCMHARHQQMFQQC